MKVKLQGSIQNQEERGHDFSESCLKRDSQFEMSFELEGKPRDSIQDLTQEFDPGSGRTLAACLTHASRAGMKESLLKFILAADG